MCATHQSSHGGIRPVWEVTETEAACQPLNKGTVRDKTMKILEFLGKIVGKRLVLACRRQVENRR